MNIETINAIISATLRATGQTGSVTDCRIGVLEGSPGATVTAHIDGGKVTCTTKAGS